MRQIAFAIVVAMVCIPQAVHAQAVEKWSVSRLGTPNTISVSPNGGTVCAIDRSDILKVWNTSEQKLISYSDNWNNANSTWSTERILFSYDLEHIFIPGDRVAMYSAYNYTYQGAHDIVKENERSIAGSCFCTSNSAPILCVGDYGRLIVYNYELRRVEASLEDSTIGDVTSVFIADTLVVVASSTYDETNGTRDWLQCFSIATCEREHMQEMPVGRYGPAAMRLDRGEIAGYYVDDTMNIVKYYRWNISRKQLVFVNEVEYGLPMGMQFGKGYLYAQGKDCVIRCDIDDASIVDTVIYESVSSLSAVETEFGLVCTTESNMYEYDPHMLEVNILPFLPNGYLSDLVGGYPDDQSVFVVGFERDGAFCLKYENGEIEAPPGLSMFTELRSSFAYTIDQDYFASGSLEIYDATNDLIAWRSVSDSAERTSREMHFSALGDYLVWGGASKCGLYSFKNDREWNSTELLGAVTKISTDESETAASVSVFSTRHDTHLTHLINLQDTVISPALAFGLTCFLRGGGAVSVNGGASAVYKMRYDIPYDFNSWEYENVTQIPTGTVSDAHLALNERILIVSYVDGRLLYYDMHADTVINIVQTNQFIDEIDVSDIDRIVVCCDYMSNVISGWSFPDGLTSVDIAKHLPEVLDVELFPNPVNQGDAVSVSVSSSQRFKADIMVYDVNGTLMNGDMLNKNAFETCFQWIETAYVPKGVYFVIVGSLNPNVSRLIVQ
jgi:WD40 repeat protein